MTTLLKKDFKATINGLNYVIDMKEQKRSKEMSNCITYDCMTFEEDMTPKKRFTIVHNLTDKTFWAWTGNCFTESDRLFREAVAEQFDSKALKL